MTKEILRYLCVCEGWKCALKQLHWNSKNLSQHKLCDSITDRLSDFQDQVGEVEQSITGNLPFNKLKPVNYKITDLKKFVEDVIHDTYNFYRKVKKLGKNYIGMSSDCESFMSDMQRNLYLVNFTLKEDFKRNYKAKKLMESRTSVPEKELGSIIQEAVHNVLSRQAINEGCHEAEVKGGDYEDNELNFTHFAVNKNTNLIVNSWDYSGYDSDDLRAHKDYYFYEDLRDNGFNPKIYKILTFKACERAGINPNDKQNWSNTGVFRLFQELQMKQSNENPFEAAYESHPDWFVGG